MKNHQRNQNAVFENIHSVQQKAVREGEGNTQRRAGPTRRTGGPAGGVRPHAAPVPAGPSRGRGDTARARWPLLRGARGPCLRPPASFPPVLLFTPAQWFSHQPCAFPPTRPLLRHEPGALRRNAIPFGRYPESRAPCHKTAPRFRCPSQVAGVQVTHSFCPAWLQIRGSQATSSVQ